MMASQIYKVPEIMSYNLDRQFNDDIEDFTNDEDSTYDVKIEFADSDPDGTNTYDIQVIYNDMMVVYEKTGVKSRLMLIDEICFNINNENDMEEDC